MIVGITRPFLDLLTLEEALMLLTLHEAKAERFGVAAKAFFVGKSQPFKDGYWKWQRTLGKQGKRQPHAAIKKVVEDLVREDPSQTAPQIWSKIPDSEHALRVETNDGRLFDVYREYGESDGSDGKERLYEVEVRRNEGGGLEQESIDSIAYDSYRRYVTNAKNSLRKS
jgi:hypothetical protein